MYDAYNTKIHTLMGGRWRYKLVVSIKVTKITITRSTNLWVEVGVTNLQGPSGVQSVQ